MIMIGGGVFLIFFSVVLFSTLYFFLYFLLRKFPSFSLCIFILFYFLFYKTASLQRGWVEAGVNMAAVVQFAVLIVVPRCSWLV